MPERIALVTGASRGIGRATAVALAEAGFGVAVGFRSDTDGAKQTLALIESIGGEGIAVEADVSRPAAVEEMFDHVEDALGPATVLVNNAGVRADGLAVRMSDETWGRVLETDLSGPFACCRRALRSMIRQRWGRIVNVASVAGLRGSAGQANYSAAKAGLIGLTRTLAREVARKGVTVNAIAPGLIDTDLTVSLTSEQRRQLIDEIPMGRAGTPEEVGQLVAFLCSERASYITGAVVVADGGMTA
ncbi:MAG TPA: 3-oxoacyl-[acyl-carrier-protein] reductase [Actinomycetota bacterium]|nr:3-oxoacyl-[acyl-carrier-protein] reductase [Actinomycetota bacterium]